MLRSHWPISIEKKPENHYLYEINAHSSYAFFFSSIKGEEMCVQSFDVVRWLINHSSSISLFCIPSYWFFLCDFLIERHSTENQHVFASLSCQFAVAHHLKITKRNNNVCIWLKRLFMLLPQPNWRITPKRTNGKRRMKEKTMHRLFHVTNGFNGCRTHHLFNSTIIDHYQLVCVFRSAFSFFLSFFGQSNRRFNHHRVFRPTMTMPLFERHCKNSRHPKNRPQKFVDKLII